jgi:hypothetical protein
MSLTLRQLRVQTLTRLGDTATQIWTGDEVDGHLVQGYLQIATALEVFWDWVYAENLPRGWSYNQPWEKAMLPESGGFDFGYANFTAEFERRMLGDERLRYGPGNYTSPFEATDGFLSRAQASTDIPATAELPKTLTALSRVLWDERAIDAMEARTLSREDSRYEITKGEVFGYIWQKDGIRTLRKVRVPAAQATTYTVDGSWGLLRSTGDLTTETVTGTWGVPRRIPGQHPIGSTFFGIPRRVYHDGMNVRIEHFRQGRALRASDDVCELPERYALYLRDYAMQKCLERSGPGQDLKLAAHFKARWARGLARIERRLQLVDAERISVMGGDGRPSVTRPPRPRLPWAYGSVVRW